jgi:hypothetical protein
MVLNTVQHISNLDTKSIEICDSFTARLGYECQGNEFSLFMLLASNFVLNKSTSKACFTIYPWLHQSTNHLSFSDMVR